jgi:sugar phosphate isomerase/epimerase
MATVPFSLQLYSIRDHMEKDPAGSLRRVKEMGYDNVELAGTAGMSAAEFRKALDDNGLAAPSGHFMLDVVRDQTTKLLDDCVVLGVKHVVVPVATSETGLPGWMQVAKDLDAAGEKMREAGLQLHYHNHAHEFERLEGTYILDHLLENTAPENVHAELDTFWVRHGGADPVAMIEKYAGRCDLLHIKDAAPRGEDPIFAELGRGEMDWPPIFAAAKRANVAMYVVEQDACKGDSLEAVAVSAEFMKTIQV